MRILDLFCGAGGAAMGMHRAYPNAEIVGVDNRPQPHYPFTFVLADALNPPFTLRDFDFIWASPPCQGYSRLRHLPWLRHKQYPLLIDAMRAMLRGCGAAYVIENVEDAPLDGGVLCGSMFGLPIRRHRRFESNVLVMFPPCGEHVRIQVGRGNRTMHEKHGGHIFGVPHRINYPGLVAGHFSNLQWAKEAMGIDWMTRNELSQAVPPAYSEYILRQIRL